MSTYIARRLLQAVPTVLGIVILGFLLIRIAPGNPARIELGQRATPAAIRQFNDSLGLNRSLGSQFAWFVSRAAHLNFGQSTSEKESVAAAIGSRLGPSALLISYSLVIAFILAVPLSVFVASREGRAADHLVRGVGMLFYAMPPFWLGVLLALIFGLELGVLPTSGYGTGLWGELKSLTLPALTLAALSTPLLVRTLRSSIIECLNADYVEAARARGFSARRVLYGHVLRNAALPGVTLGGMIIGWLVSTTVVVETVFGLPGLGSLLVSAVTRRDFALVQGLVIVLGVTVVVVNIITDVVIALLDPRIRV